MSTLRDEPHQAHLSQSQETMSIASIKNRLDGEKIIAQFIRSIFGSGY